MLSIAISVPFLQYALILLLPASYLLYRFSPSLSLTSSLRLPTWLSSPFSSQQPQPTPAESDPKKPLKSIMQAPRDDLAPPKDDPYTTEELKQYDGTDASKPILVAIKGTIFDVSSKKDVYGPGRSYSIFAGKDGSRGLGMSSLKPEDALADYSTLDEKDKKVLDDWHAFFTKRYNVVGKVSDGPVVDN
ncbi:hypothetical protein GALMADRAFT_257777 [Galerina marginata CBS 339.88]|uniref:Cytochrome b5 heme-binding domain-containing protein n=1 Tax=Galerina marginata (strain CBS 339.88) TaxID=685588 RepID=A0A067SD29_GALM3|nr:hypothetical protein GALMADRAFT_257777 [Galerina marginata CBS 339.88]